MQPKVKILTGYSEKGGSTTAFIRLTNALNKNNIDCTLYGPHDWHLDKCKSDKLQQIRIDTNDIFITHFLPIKKRPQVKKVILACHEKNLYEVGDVKQYWDIAVFLNNTHREYHNRYNGAFTLIPNLKDDTLISVNKPHLNNIAGIIGSIDENKQTHVSIERAIADRCDVVYIFGTINDVNYFNNFVKPLLSNNTVKLMPFQTNKQEMYNMIGKVYHSAKSECACLVKDECFQTNTKFNGNNATTHDPSQLENHEIINKWLDVIKL